MFLYKIVTKDLWETSLKEKTLIQSDIDIQDNFIHFAKEEQIDHVISKFFANDEFVIALKINVKQLNGNLILETNPGGNTLYYHLYKGFIPFSAIVDFKIITKTPDKTDK